MARQSGGDILEIGCNEGRTLRDLALLNPGRRVLGVDYTGTDSTLGVEQKGEQPPVGRIGAFAKDLPNVRVINMNSGHLADVLEANQFKFIFIDGDHSLEGVRTDTEVALRLLAPGGIIAWHDCHDGAPAWVGVKRYLTGLSMEIDLVQVAGTWLALYLNGYPL